MNKKAIILCGCMLLLSTSAYQQEGNTVQEPITQRQLESAARRALVQERLTRKQGDDTPIPTQEKIPQPERPVEQPPTIETKKPLTPTPIPAKLKVPTFSSKPQWARNIRSTNIVTAR